MTKPRQLLISHLRKTEHLTKDDPLFSTKQFLDIHNISYKDFFPWVVAEAARWNYSVNTDKGVRILLQ